MYKRITSDMYIILIWITIAFISITSQIFEGTYVRTIFAIPTILFIPGYVLITALFPNKDDMGITERISIGFGLSIAIVSLLGLFLSLTFGIRLIPILITLYTYTIIIVLVVIYRQGKSQKSQKYVQSRIDNIVDSNARPRREMDNILTVILIFMSILASVTVYYAIATPKAGEKFTEFYVLNTDRKADNYSTSLLLNSPTTLYVGAANNEYRSMNYTVNIVMNSSVLATEKLVLNHGDVWEKNITFVPDKIGTNMKLELLLFKEDDYNIPYRKLRLWINVA